MIDYRSFRNEDPPELVRLWNSAVEGRAARPIHVDTLESLVLARPYFDPRGLILALDEGRPVGYVHAGFGCASSQDRLDFTLGVVSAILVNPDCRRRGIGRELLRRAEQYLGACGAQVVYAGGMSPLNPFYLGLYGGSELPGFLDSSQRARPFLEACGYRGVDHCTVLQVSLTAPCKMVDVRFLRIRRSSLIEEDGPARRSWCWACTMGLFEQRHFRLLAKGDRRQLAKATAWDMHHLGRSRGEQTAGLVDVEVAEDVRGQGMGKFLVNEVLQRLREQFVARVEVQTMQRNRAAIGLYESLGFEEVDRGTIYRKDTE